MGEEYGVLLGASKEEHAAVEPLDEGFDFGGVDGVVSAFVGGDDVVEVVVAKEEDCLAVYVAFFGVAYEVAEVVEGLLVGYAFEGVGVGVVSEEDYLVYLVVVFSDCRFPKTPAVDVW